MDSNFNGQENTQYSAPDNGQGYTQYGAPDNGQGNMPYGTQGNTPYNGQPYGTPPSRMPGEGKAIASLIVGLIGVLTLGLITFSFLPIILGVVGLILAGMSKKEGFQGGLRTAGFVLSIIALVGGALEFVACIGCIGTVFFLTDEADVRYMGRVGLEEFLDAIR